MIARLINKPVVDHTTVNQTLDSSNSTFPLGRSLYADFSHDNDITGIIGALGLFNSTAPLSNTTFESAAQTNGFTASRVVPFSGRVYIEKMVCSDAYTLVQDQGAGSVRNSTEELIRIILNDCVLPLEQCGGDRLGRCTVSNFVDSLLFAQEGGLWRQC